MANVIRRLLLAAMVAGWTAAAWGQQVEGRVTDAATGLGLADASLLVSGTPYGTAAADDGRYALRGLAPGNYFIVARAVGYTEASRRVRVEAGQTLTVDFSLRPDVIEMDVVEVVSSRLQDQRDPQPSVIAIQPRATRALAGGAEDVLRTLQTTPGVFATNDYSTQLIVRGGGPDENLMLLDDVEIFNPYRLYGVVSVFNPAIVSDIRLLTGGFPARYGDRLSSVLDVDVRPGTKEHALAGSINASVSNANLVFEGGTGFLDGSWLLAGRRTYYDLVLSLLARGIDTIDDNTTFPNFADLQGKLVLNPGPNHRLQFGAIVSHEKLEIGLQGDASINPKASDADRLEAENDMSNDVAYAAWHWTPSAALQSKVTLSWYRNGGTAGSGGRYVPRDFAYHSGIVASSDTINTIDFTFDQSFVFKKWALGQQTSWQRGRHLVEGGAGVDLLDTTLRYDLDLNDIGKAYFELLQENNPFGVGALTENFDQGKRYPRMHVFLQDRVSLFGERLFVQPGLRYDYYRIIDASYLSPRFNFSLVLGPSTTLRGAWGRFAQSPGFEKLIDGREVYDLSQGGIEGLTAEHTTHYVLGLSQWFQQRYQLRVEAYLKQFDDLIVQKRETRPRYVATYTGQGGVADPEAYDITLEAVNELTTTPINDARGRAYGVEVSFEKRYAGPEDRLSGWISYAYSEAYRTRSSYLVPGTRIKTPFDYDRPHMLNVVVDYRIGRGWQLGATFRYGTGFPYTPAVGYVPVVVADFNLDDPSAPPEVRVLENSQTGLARFEVDYGEEENINSGRLPDYHRLDVRVSRAVRLFGRRGQVYLDVINVYNRTNVVGYRYAAITSASGQKSRPPQIIEQTLNMLSFLPSVGFSIDF